MKVHVYPADTKGCGHYRMIWPAQILKQMGCDVVLHMPNDRQDIRAKVVDDVVTEVFYPEDADVIVFQRVTHKYLAQAISCIRERGVAVVIDMDDDLSCLSPNNPAFTAMHPKSNFANHGSHSWNTATIACKNATLTTLSTSALQQTYGFGHGVVINNAVPDVMLSVPMEDNVAFGYPGAIATHYDDVAELGFSIAQLMNDGFRFATIGDTRGIGKLLCIDEDAVHKLGSVDLNTWPFALASLGVGLAPLNLNKFNRAKSWLKPLELAAVGVPCVMSPSREYQRICAQGIGIIAKKPRVFYQEIRRLLTNDQYRIDTAHASREAAKAHVLSKYAEQWYGAWTRAYQAR